MSTLDDLTQMGVGFVNFNVCSNTYSVWGEPRRMEDISYLSECTEMNNKTVDKKLSHRFVFVSDDQLFSI